LKTNSLVTLAPVMRQIHPDWTPPEIRTRQIRDVTVKRDFRSISHFSHPSNF